MSVYDLTQTIPAPSSLVTGDILNCPYSGSVKSITLPKGTYKLECWGAQGCYYTYTSGGGKGGYSYGTLNLSGNTVLYLYSGGGGNVKSATANFNGGGKTNSYGGSGGGPYNNNYKNSNTRYYSTTNHKCYNYSKSSYYWCYNDNQCYNQ